ncbi:MAG: SDR family oxidoreductase [bacterium]|nr:SDR family oxidoreductase [bacterium]
MVQKLFDIHGKIALITGSSQGIGFVLAKGLAEAGCTVIINGRDKLKAEKAVSSLKEMGHRVFYSIFDVSDEKAVEDQIKKIQITVGSIDILINNAGIQIRNPLEKFQLSDWEQLMNVNLTGVFVTSKAVVQTMIERKKGKIINICSIQSELARPTIAPYTASKGGVRNLTRGMATDWGKYNIQVNGIAPGYFKTAMTKKLYEDKEFDEWLRSRTPANRWGDPDELVGSAIFLASRASDYINGHIIYVDGGMLGCV